MTEQVKKLMTTLGITEQEALEIVNADKEIDRGAKLYSLDKEAEKESKKARQSDRKKPMVCKFDTTKKAKPANETKTSIVSNVVATLEQMGATVDWDGSIDQITINKKGNEEMIMQVEHEPVLIGGRRYSMLIAPRIVNSRTFIPLRFVSEHLGYDVAWDGATQTVTATNGEITINLTIDNTGLEFTEIEEYHY